MSKAKTKEVSNYAVTATDKNGILTQLITEFGLDLKAASAYYNDNYKGTKSAGFFDGYLEFLVSEKFTEESATKYIEANGSANTLKNVKHYLKIAEAVNRLK